MKKTNRRNFLRKGATAAAAVAAGVAGAAAVNAQAPAKGGGAAAAQMPATKTAGMEKWEKKASKTTELFNSTVSYGPLLFISGLGYHQAGDIKVHTADVFDQLKKTLEAAGSSMAKVVKCNVYLKNMKDFDGMNEVYKGKFGDAPPVRTTIAAADIPGNSLVEIDVIAYI